MRSSFHSNVSPQRDWDMNEMMSSPGRETINSNLPYHKQDADNEGSVQIKRPTTAVPYTSQDNTNFQWNSAQLDGNNQKINTYFNTATSNYNTIQQQQLPQQQKQLPFLNQQLISSSSQSQLTAQQLLQKFQGNSQLPHHLSNSSAFQNPSVNPFFNKSSLPQDYAKLGNQKMGLRPKTALSKGIRSPTSAYSSIGSVNFTDNLRNHQSHHQIYQADQRRSSNDGKKYEKNMKGFSSPMFIKGQQVKPSFNRETGSYQFSQH